MYPEIELIVLVEDDPFEAELFQKTIRDMGLSSFVRVFRTGGEAVENIMAIRPDSFPVSLFVLDIDLPDFGGTSVCNMIKQHPFLSDSSIVFLTHMPSRKSYDLKEEHPGVEVFKKPVSLDEYEVVITNILEYAKRSQKHKVA